MNSSWLITILTNITTAPEIDWQAVAEERGIARKDNARTSFRTQLKKIGLEYTADNKFKKIDGFDASALAAVSGDEDGNGRVMATPKKSPTKRKAKDVVMKGSDEDGIGGGRVEHGEGSPTKKTKKGGRKATTKEGVNTDDQGKIQGKDGVEVWSLGAGMEC